MHPSVDERRSRFVRHPVVAGCDHVTGDQHLADVRPRPVVRTEVDPEPVLDAAELAAAEAAAADVATTLADGSVVDPKTGEVTAPPTSTTKPKKKAPAKKAAAAAKPRTASIFKSMDLATIDLDTALRLLDLPRVVGVDPESGAEILAQNGKFGPYLKKGVDTRSLTSEDQIFDIDLAGAVELYAQPKYGARRASSALKEFEAPDPESGKAIRIKDGRFGAYVTDGVTNATIPKAETVDDVDFDRAVQLLADKRAKGPAVKKAPAKKAAAKKPATKKAPAKKTGSPTVSAATSAARSASAQKAAATRAANKAAAAAAAAETATS